jgi:epoxyqueuosine reductase
VSRVRDSGPLRERELAARAGLGWQGKHTNLISLDLGNFFFLAALLTTLDLRPDEPFSANHCGTCTRCITACPTGAIIAPLTLDARRCVSYLTIEHRGPIPLELRPLMGDRLLADLETEEGFRARFRGTPLLRPKREGLRRNVCVALGNVGGRDAVAPLADAATGDPSEVVQEAATWALARIEMRHPSPDAIY